MADNATGPIEIKETDIVFDCPQCGKSLAIDYRGAGLFVTCPDCENRVPVPIPEGMEVSDMDAKEEDKTLSIIHLREALQHAQQRIGELESEVDDLKVRREKLEAFKTENTRRFEDLTREVHAVEKSLANIAELLKRSSESIQQVR